MTRGDIMELEEHDVIDAINQIHYGYTEAVRQKVRGRWQYAICVGENTDPAYDDVKFGDVLVVDHLDGVDFAGFWKMPTCSDGSDSIMVCDSTHTQWLALNRSEADVYFVEAYCAAYVLRNAFEDMTTRKEHEAWR
jgi:hypothetical protein